KACDSNIVFSCSGKYCVGIYYDGNAGDEEIPWEDWLKLNDAGYDKNTLLMHPGFIDAENNNFALKPDSAAVAFGFKAIDQAKIGLTDKFRLNKYI
ncbi:MAG: hypothetical protein N2489_08675, partial [Clostridia bacterium]|nr:hypothetical protein [Clostridia bacterium]